MNDLERLLAIEDIKSIKARYWEGVDFKREAVLASVFTEDAVIDFNTESTDPNRPFPKPAAFAAHCLKQLENFTTAHHGHVPQIEFLSDTEAKATWPMEDNLWAIDEAKGPYKHLHGYGYYLDSYRKTADGWRISATTLKRWRVDKS
jgi:hypothetical protein